MTRNRILVVCAVDIMAWGVLRPWLSALRDEGWEVHVACADGPYIGRLRNDGYTVHIVAMRRTFRPWHYIRPLWQLWRLVRTGRFVIVNTHGPIGGLLGRPAARLAGAGCIVHMVHGFYFHENMSGFAQAPLIALEWLLGRFTDHFLFVSDEDRASASRYGISARRARCMTLYNCVDTAHFVPAELVPGRRTEIRELLGIARDSVVVGIVARIVREKGFREFLDMARLVVQKHPSTMFLVVGETLSTDRDQYGAQFRREIEAAGLLPRFRLTGQAEDVASYLNAMDIFVLPSYREGFPVSILEAMSSGLPVIAANIRGCRESVEDGATGRLVPPRDSAALSEAVVEMLCDPETARAMGRAGRTRVEARFAMVTVQRRYLEFLRIILEQ